MRELLRRQRPESQLDKWKKDATQRALEKADNNGALAQPARDLVAMFNAHHHLLHDELHIERLGNEREEVTPEASFRWQMQDAKAYFFRPHRMTSSRDPSIGCYISVGEGQDMTEHRVDIYPNTGTALYDGEGAEFTD